MFVTIKGKQAMNLRRSGGGKKGTQKIISIWIKKLQKKFYLYISDFWLLQELSQGQGPFKEWFLLVF